MKLILVAKKTIGMNKIILLFFFTLLSTFSFSQELKRQIGLNVAATAKMAEDFEGVSSGIAVNFINQKHYFSVGWYFLQPFYMEESLNEFDLNYRIYPNTSSRIFNLYFCTGIDYTRLNKSYIEDNNSNNYHTSTNHSIKQQNAGLGIGFGFQINITKNLNFSTSLSNFAYFADVNNRETVTSIYSVKTYDHRTLNFSGFSELWVFNLGYNFDLKKKRLKETE